MPCLVPALASLTASPVGAGGGVLSAAELPISRFLSLTSEESSTLEGVVRLSQVRVDSTSSVTFTNLTRRASSSEEVPESEPGIL